MRDISRKPSSLRTAKAVGAVLCSEEIFHKLKNDLLPKGPWQELVRAAGLLGSKQTQHLIPHCHPVSIDGFSITYEWIDPNEGSEMYALASHHYGVAIVAEGTLRVYESC